jgi:hypothetical protein
MQRDIELLDRGRAGRRGGTQQERGRDRREHLDPHADSPLFAARS